MMHLSWLQNKNTSGTNIKTVKIDLMNPRTIGKKNQQIEIMTMWFLYKTMIDQVIFKRIDIQTPRNRIAIKLFDAINGIFFHLKMSFLSYNKRI